MKCTPSRERSSTHLSFGSLVALAQALRQQRRQSAEMFFVALVIASLCVYAVACQRIVLVSEASPTRIGSKVYGRLYTLGADGSWTLSDNEVLLPEGWYLVPPSYVAEEK